MISKRHFEKVKILFAVENVEEFKDKLIAFKEKDELTQSRNGYSGSFSSFRAIYEVIVIDKIGTLN